MKLLVIAALLVVGLLVAPASAECGDGDNSTQKVFLFNNVRIEASCGFNAGLLPDGQLQRQGGWMDVGNNGTNASDDFDSAILVNVTSNNSILISGIALATRFNNDSAIRNLKIYEAQRTANGRPTDWAQRNTSISFAAGQSKIYKIYFQRNTYKELNWSFIVTAGGENITLDPTVSSCGDITSAGIYTVTAALTAPAGKTCLNVTASNVLIDGQGFAMTGNNAVGTVGINVTSKFIQNVTMRHFSAIKGFQYGFTINNGKTITVLNNTVSLELAARNLWGLNSSNVTNLYILNNSFINLRATGTNTLAGVDLGTTNNSVIYGNTLKNLSARTVYGIRITGSDNLTIDSAVITNFQGVGSTQSSVFVGILSSATTGLQPTNLTIRNTTIHNFNSQVGSSVAASCDTRGMDLNSNAGQGNLSIISAIVHNITACGDPVTPTDGLSYGIIVNNALNSTFRDLDIYNISSVDAGNGAASAYGFYCSTCADSNATRVNIDNISGTSGLLYGFDIFGSARFSFLQLNVSRANPALYVESSSADVLLTNSSLTSNLPSANDISFTAGSHRLTSVNSTFNKTKITYANAQNLSIKWYVLVNVTNQTMSPIANAFVNISNASDLNNHEVVNNLTDANGLSAWFTLTQFIGNSSFNVTYTPHNFTGFKTGFSANTTNATINMSQIVLLVLPQIAAAAEFICSITAAQCGFGIIMFPFSYNTVFLRRVM